MAQLESMIQSNLGIADQFVQSFERPYGRLWKKQLLVDAKKTNIEQFARAISSHASDARWQQLRETGSRLGSTAALVGVILLLYFFVNAVTKGYFVWRSRAIALLLALVGVITIIALVQ